ncbi:MAG: calcium:proton antiporter [Planctomycetota bacterium]
MIRSELQIVAGVATAALFVVFGASWLSDLSSPWWVGAMFVWIFAVMLWSSFGVVRHADCLAIRLGEPLGTLILTVSVISIEVVMISAVMLTGSNNPGLARDTVFAVIMVVLNGMSGLAILLGGLKHDQPAVNLQGANAYLAILIPLSVLTLVVPNYTRSAPGGIPGPVFGIFLTIICIVLYLVFLGIQTMRHRQYFVQPESDVGPDHEHDDHGFVVRSVPYHAVLLVLTMVPIVLLSKSMAKIVDHGIASAGMPVALGGLLVAVLVLSPEALAAFKAARANRLQRSINISMGSGLATIALTIPSVLIIGMATGRDVELGLGRLDVSLLLLTLGTMIVNASGSRTNVLQGVVHLTLFFAYLVLLFD